MNQNLNEFSMWIKKILYLSIFNFLIFIPVSSFCETGLMGLKIGYAKIIENGKFEDVFNEMGLKQKISQTSFVNQVKTITGLDKQSSFDEGRCLFDVYSLFRNGKKIEKYIFILKIRESNDCFALFINNNKFLNDKVEITEKYQDAFFNVFELDDKIFTEFVDSSGGTGIETNSHSIYLWDENKIKRCLQFELDIHDDFWHAVSEEPALESEKIERIGNREYLVMPFNINYSYGVCFDRDELEGEYGLQGDVNKNFTVCYYYDPKLGKIIFEPKESNVGMDAEQLCKNIGNIKFFLDVCYDDLVSRVISKNPVDRKYITCFIRTCEWGKLSDVRIKKLKELLIKMYGSFPDYKNPDEE